MKIAVITGASSGMGRAMVREAADRFGGLSEIWVIARRRELLESLRGQVPVPLKILPLDLQRKEDLETLRAALKEHQPEVKLLVNGAGFGRTGPVESLSTEESTGMVRLNCEALVSVTELVLPYMSANSRILQFASAAAFLPQPGFAVYAASKAFVLSYSRALAAELREKGIYVTAVCPGPVDTEFFTRSLEPGQKLPLYKRLAMAKPENVVRTALSDSMKGKELSVPGILMKGFFLLCRLVPQGILIRLAGTDNYFPLK